MILTDREIQISIQQGLIIIQPPPASDLFFSSTALDLTLDSHYRTFNEGVAGIDKVIDPSNKGTNSDKIIKEITTAQEIPADGFSLPKGQLILGWTVEYVKLDLKARIAARVEGKSSLAKLGLGVHVTAPTIHAGFEGQIQLEIINHGSVPIRLRPNMRICQLIFESTTGTPVKGYDGQFLRQTADAPKLMKKTRAARA